jgi:hypothetical protein
MHQDNNIHTLRKAHGGAANPASETVRMIGKKFTTR